jgi:hypothetical protein
VDERVAAKFEISLDAAIAFTVFCEPRGRLRVCSLTHVISAAEGTVGGKSLVGKCKRILAL